MNEIYLILISKSFRHSLRTKLSQHIGQFRVWNISGKVREETIDVSGVECYFWNRAIAVSGVEYYFRSGILFPELTKQIQLRLGVNSGIGCQFVRTVPTEVRVIYVGVGFIPVEVEMTSRKVGAIFRSVGVIYRAVGALSLLTGIRHDRIELGLELVLTFQMEEINESKEIPIGITKCFRQSQRSLGKRQTSADAWLELWLVRLWLVRVMQLIAQTKPPPRGW